ncbi:MAG: hypothetical protein KME65_17485 [Candidatus Thiodiazotropha sp. (ex Ctena orbiculata)]|uniref:YD repeat-containing protein n=1 Tax=Candidatus Thiodiazotropha taylori TaxID=2792791 RepID=A0A944QV20_9GAMM|nr:hypothetical protein [Candidatus Thiodiazotropha taylori]
MDSKDGFKMGCTNDQVSYLKSPRKFVSIFTLLCLISTTSSHAVKCIQAGYTADEGAIYCTPSFITDTYYYAYVAWPSMKLEPFDTFEEAQNAMSTKLAGSPYCAQATSGGGPIVDEPWGTYGHRVTQRTSRSGQFVSGPYVRDHSQQCTYGGEGHWHVAKVEHAKCEGGQVYGWFLASEGGDDTMVCGDPLPTSECKVANPVDIFSGNKLQREQHITGYGNNALSLNWYYNAQRKLLNPYSGEKVTDHPLLTSRPSWLHGYEKRLYFSDSGIRPVIERVHPEDSRSLYLIKMGENNWVDALGIVVPQIEERLEEPAERWKYTAPDGKSEFYDPQGRLVKQLDSQGRATMLSYVDGRLSQVSNWKGHTLDFAYDANGVLESVTDSTAHVYRYQFDSDGLLTSVSFPDETPGDDNDNPTRIYRYEDSNIPYALTSIIDENGQVAASWSYDGSGRAISSSHAGGADATTINYGDNSTTVTNSLVKETTYHFSIVQNDRGIVYKSANKIDRVEGHPSTHCAGANTDYEYNNDGFVTKKSDWNDNVTTYSRDTEGRELSRTEAAYTSEARTITTDWDTTLNKPLVVTEPDRVTEYSYDTQGRLLSKIQRENTN